MIALRVLRGLSCQPAERVAGLFKGRGLIAIEADLEGEAVALCRRQTQRMDESNLGQAQVSLSYPYGQVSESISRLAKSIGYSCAIAGDAGPNDQGANLYELSRTVIASDDDIATFSARVSGLTWWISRGRRLFHPEIDVSWEPSFFRRYGSAAAQSYLDS